MLFVKATKAMNFKIWRAIGGVVATKIKFYFQAG